ncbi:PDR/VanB family oxidoreductase [Massilia sp. METH4]|uniref:PDR/VanB family oxidoreductase n=1 Tax=Massilia sp. METH4 TaxID=3123041 RepID=UPI0030D309CF
MDDLSVRIESRKQVADDIVSLELVAADGTPLPPFTAGAHIDIKLGPGLVRQYSLCNDSSESGHYRIAVLRDPASRGGSIAVHDRLRVGDTVRISAPRNHFALSEAPRSLLFAGGIGVTPILAFAKELRRSNAQFELHYCARSATKLVFRDELAEAAGDGRAFFYLDDGGPRLDIAAVLAAHPNTTPVYVCGPGGFIDHVLGAARAAGWPEALLRREYFAAAPVSADADPDGAFDIELAKSGMRLQVPAGCTIIQVLAEHGVDIPVSCEQGVCGTCLTRVLAGEPDHRDMYLTDDEHIANDQMTPCCSRARSACLVLDL